MIDHATQPQRFDRALAHAVPSRPQDARAYSIGDLWCLRLPLPYPRTSSVNVYLLPDGEGWTLVDCGSAIGSGWASLLHALALADVDPGAVHTLVLTHLHPDHASLAGTVVQRLGCRLLRLDAPAAGLDVLRDPALDLDGRRRRALAEGVPREILDDMVDLPVAGDGRQPRPAPDRLLQQGDLVAGCWETVAMPGHCANQLGLFDPVRRWLISADVAYVGAPPYLEWGWTPDPWTDHLATLARVEALGASRLLPGHGRPDDAPAVRCAASRDKLLRDGEAVAAALAQGPGSAYAVAARQGPELDPDGSQSRLSFVLCVLEQLTAAGRARSDGADDVRIFTAVDR